MEDKDDVRYCVTAIIDLQGFSSHLEIAGYDLLTNIGQQAIRRLQILESAIQKLEEEKIIRPEYYPDNLKITRINDSIFVSMDLPEFLKPSIGKAVKYGLQFDEVKLFFSKAELENGDKFHERYVNLSSESIGDLIKYVGLISRVHAFIQKTESREYFPGVKTVMATGFRKPFYGKSEVEDYFSANFSLSNAYAAEKMLRGPFLYIDNYVLQMLCYNQFALNIVRHATFILSDKAFNPLDQIEDPFFLPSTMELADPVEVDLFRKKFLFRKLDPSSLSFLQSIEKIREYLEGKVESKAPAMYGETFNLIKRGMGKGELEAKKAYSYGVRVISSDIGKDINTFYEIVSTGVIEQYAK